MPPKQAHGVGKARAAGGTAAGGRPRRVTVHPDGANDDAAAAADGTNNKRAADGATPQPKARRRGLWQRLTDALTDSDAYGAITVALDTVNIMTRTSQQSRDQLRADLQRQLMATAVKQVGEQEAPQLVANLMVQFDEAMAEKNGAD